MALSGDRIVTIDGNGAVRVFNAFSCLLVLLMSLTSLSSDTVEMIKQFPERDTSPSLSFHGDVAYIGDIQCAIQWNVDSDAVVKLEGYPGLIFKHLLPAWLQIFFRSSCWSRSLS